MSAVPIRRAVVVGASTGIGAALVRRLARQGASIAALARRADRLAELARECEGTPGRVVVRAHDVKDVEDIPALLAELEAELGGLDLVVYNAGILFADDPGAYDTEKDLEVVAVNYAGFVAWANAAAVRLAARRAGTLVGVSSVAADRGRRANPIYGSTKAAMDHYLEGLRNRLAKDRVHVCTIKPGFIDTDMIRGKRTFWVVSADECARLILAAVRSRATVRYVPRRWRLVGLALKLIPSFVFRRLNV